MTSSLYSDGAASDEGPDDGVQQPQPLAQQHVQLPPPWLEPPRSPPHAAGLFVLEQPCPRSPVLGGAAAPAANEQQRLRMASVGSLAAAHSPPRQEQAQRPRGSLLDQLLGVSEQGLQAAGPAVPAPRPRPVAPPQQAPPVAGAGRPRLLFAAVQPSSPGAANPARASSQQGLAAQREGQSAQQPPRPRLPSMLEMILGHALPSQQPEAEQASPAAAATGDASSWHVPPQVQPGAQAAEKEEVELPAHAASTGHLFDWKQRRAPAVQQQQALQQRQVQQQQIQQPPRAQQPRVQRQAPQGQQQQPVPVHRPAVQPRGLQGPPHRPLVPPLLQQPRQAQELQQPGQAQHPRAEAQHAAVPAAQAVQRAAVQPPAARRQQAPAAAQQPSGQQLRAAGAAAAAAAAAGNAADAEHGASPAAAAQPAASPAAAEAAAVVDAAAAAPGAALLSRHDASPPAAGEAAGGAAGGLAAAPVADEPSSQDVQLAASHASYDGPRDLESFLPAALAAAFHEEGIHELRPWQASCLTLPGVMPLEGEQGAARPDQPPANLVFSAPTGDGKSLVAEVVMLRALAAEMTRGPGVGRKAMLVLSLVSACNAQARRLEKLLQPMGLEVERAYGSHHSENWLQRNTGVIVATPERAQMLLNRKLAAGVDPTSLFSVVVLDEIHEVAGGRGHTYRSLLCKLRYMQATAEGKLQQEAQAGPANGGSPANGNSQANGSPANGSSQANGSQANSSQPGSQAAAAFQPMRIVCMSATRTGQSATARLLGAQVYVKSTEREVQLECFLVLREGRVVDQQEQVVRQLPQGPGQTVMDRVAALCTEAVAESQQALVFCGTKAGCEVSAKALAKALGQVPELPREHEPARQEEGAPPPAGPEAATPVGTPTEGTPTPTRAGFAEQLRQLGSQGDSKAAVLAGLVERGVAFHHAGMPRPAQQLVLEAFRTGAISFLCCTTTLAMSVNLPAERVIFRDAWVGLREMHLDPDRFHQMAGRAGRPGMAALGRAFLLCGKEQPPEAYLRGLLRSQPGEERPAPVLRDCAVEVLCGHLLEAVAGCGARTAEDITRFLKCTYAGAANMRRGADRLPDEVVQNAKAALRWLGRPCWPRPPAGQAEGGGDRELAMIEFDPEGARFLPLPLGRAVFASSLQLEEALCIRAEMAQAMRQLDLTSDLQPCFLSVSPYHLPDMTDRQWRKLFAEWSHAPVNEKDALLRLAGSNEEAGFAERFQHFLITRQQEAGPEGGQLWHMRPARPEEQRCQRLCQRLLTALALRALLQEGATEEGVRQEFGYGDLGRAFADMREHCGVFAGKASAFAMMVGQSRGAEGWTYLAAVLKRFQAHLRSGSKLELLSLRELEDVDEATARLLYNSGLMDLQAVADADEDVVYSALLNRPQGKSNTQEAEQRARRQAREIQQAAREAVGDPTRGLRSRGKQVLKKRRGRGGRQQQRHKRARPSTGGREARESSTAAAEEEEEEVAEDGEAAEGRTTAEESKEGDEPTEADEEMEEAGSSRHQTAASAAGTGAGPASGRQPGGHLQKRKDSGGRGDSSPASKRARWEPLPLPTPWRRPQQEQHQQEQQEQRQHRQEQQQQQQQQQQRPERALLPQHLLPCGRLGAAEQNSGDDDDEGSESDDASSSSSQGGNSEAEGGAEDSEDEGPHASSARAAASVVVICTPAPGTCHLRLCSSLQELRQLCAALRNKQLSCLGFALHTAAAHDASAGMMLPPPPRRGAQGAQQQQQLQQQQPAKPPAAGELLGVGISWRSGAAAYVPLRRSDGSLDAAAAEELATLLDPSRSGSLGATCFRPTLDLQGQVLALQSLLHPGAERWQRLPAQVVDIRLAAWLLHPSSSALYSGAGGCSLGGRPGKGRQESKLEGMLDRVLGKIAGPGSTAAEAARAAWASLTPAAAAAAVAAAAQQQPAADGRSLQASPPADGWLQACQLAAASRVGWELLLPQLRSVPRLMDALLEQEQPLALVLAAMERAGMGCSSATWERLARRLKARLEQIQGDVDQLPDVRRLKRTISLASRTQVPNLLFRDLQLRPPPCAKKLKSGLHSTDKEAIGRMIALGQTHPVLPLILEYRKAKSTLSFVAKLMESARRGVAGMGACAAGANAADGAAGGLPAVAGAGGPGAGPRIRQPLLQTNSDTGRLAMDDPSLQCVPNAHELLLRTRDPTTGREVQPSGAAAEACPRRGFVAAPGCVLLSADYKQAELRLMAHFSGDETLRGMFEEGQQDVFELLAARWLKHGDGSQVTRAERDRAKAITYALIYGLGHGKLGEDLGITAKEAEAEKARFLASLPKLQAFLDQVVEDCRRTGYVEMLSGRRRWLLGITSTDWIAKGKAERAAVNTLVQGSAADVAKRAMLALHARLPSQDACLVNMVHDELLLEVRADRLQRVAALVRDAMEGAAPEVTVPLRVQLRAGPSWGDLQPLELQPLPESEDVVGATQAGPA